MLKLENIEVTLGQDTRLGRKILNHLSLEVNKGEFVVIIGSNGAGKSTMFNVISGATKVDSGKITILDREVTKLSQIARARSVSKVIQDPKVGTIANMTILENLAFAYKRGQKRGLTKFTDKARLELFKQKLIDLNIGLECRLNELVSNLSGGQRQALSVVMAMLQRADILLLDEITAALDPASSEVIMRLTSDIVRQQQLTCIMITHDLSHAIKYGDRLLVLKNGAIAKEYAPEVKQRLTQAELIADFVKV